MVQVAYIVHSTQRSFRPAAVGFRKSGKAVSRQWRVVRAMFDAREIDPFALECSPAQADADALDFLLVSCLLRRDAVSANSRSLLSKPGNLTQDLALEVGSDVFVQTVQARYQSSGARLNLPREASRMRAGACDHRCQRLSTCSTVHTGKEDFLVQADA